MASAQNATDPTLDITVRKAESGLILSWFGTNAVPYQVEASSTLSSWTNSGPLLVGAGATLLFTNPIDGPGRGFYRVRRLAPIPEVTAVFDPLTGVLTVTGNDFDNTITASRDATGTIQINNGEVPVSGGVATVDNTVLIEILGKAGNDTLTLSSGLPPGHLFGDSGDDVLIGGSGSDMLEGGNGNDTLHGGQGSDVLLGGNGDDIFTWDPGDGSDTVEGQAGTDRLVFNGSNANENISLSANGQRLRFFRDVANVTLDADGVEEVDFKALGGVDSVAVNDLAGTAVTQVNVDLAATGGLIADAQSDAVVVNGTAGSDTFNISADSGDIVVDGIAAQVRVKGYEVEDRVVINGVGNDLVNVNGSGEADTMQVLPSSVAGYARVIASGYSASVDVSGALTLSVNGLGGPDTISCSGNLAGLAIPLVLDGGDGDDTILGGNGNEVLVGGDGNDFLDGNQGSDVLLGGNGDDIFQWDPGDGSDTIEGQGGANRLVFNGANVNENINLSANGQRFRFFRDIGNVTLDVDGVQTVDFRASGGTDNIVVNDLAGTAVTQVDIDLAALGTASADGQPDTVNVTGTPGADTFNFSADAGEIVVDGFAAQVRVKGYEVEDRVVINGVGNDLVNVNGSSGADTMQVVPSTVAGYARVIASGYSASVDVSGALTLSVNGLGGPDTISCSGNLAGLAIPLVLDGGDGDDTILGGNGNDVLVGGDGNDFLDGNQGNDVVLMGAGDDTFQWDPGDGSDTVEGQSGADQVVFHGSNVGENIDLSANGQRLRLFRNVANVTLDADGVEEVDFTALGGVDNVVVNSLAGTSVTLVNLDLAGVLGGATGDSQTDTVTVNGTDAPDTINVTASDGLVEVNGLAALVQIAHAEASFDSLIINGLGGTDTLTLDPGVSAMIAPTLNQ